jgi:hypothetical protein
MKSLLSASALLVFALPLFAEAPRKLEDPAPKPVTVPFEILKSGHMAVMVKVNGQGPYKLIFDTGAPVNLLNNKVAKAAGLLEGVKKPAFAPFGSAGEVKIKTLEVGDQKAEDVPAVVMDHPTVEAISKALGPIDGLVGFPFFARFRMTLDYQAKTMTLVPNGYQPPDVMRSMAFALLSGDQPKVLSPAGYWGFVATKKDGDEEAGVDVKDVMPDSPAAKAGLKAGDRLLTVDHRWTDSLTDLYFAASLIKPGKAIPIVVKREGKDVTLNVTPVSGL